jgi:peptide deformylase
MSKLKIYTFPDLVLAQKAKPIERVDHSYFKIADDMLETMYDAPGIGLAANQVGLLERLVVIDVDYDPGDEESEKNPDLETAKKNPIVLLNPEIIYREGATITKEGCLSVPDFRSEVKRSDKIKVKYQNVDGLERELSAEGLLAVCIQHELDHLEGTLFIDRLSQLKKDFAKKKLIKARRDRER